MQTAVTAQAGQIRWSRIFNRDPTPPSAFWPPLLVEDPSTPGADSPTERKILRAQLPRWEAYVLSTHSSTVPEDFDDKRSSLRSLKRFLEKGIGVDAIRIGKRGSRWSSKYTSKSSRSDMAPPLHLTKAISSFDGNQEGEQGNSPPKVSLVSDQCLVARKNSSKTGIAPTNSLELLFNQRSEDGDMKNRDRVTIYKRARQALKTKYAKPVLAIKERARNLTRVAKRACSRSPRRPKASRESGIVPYPGT